MNEPDNRVPRSPLPTPGDPIDAIRALSHRIGADPRLVQPGGGNTSVKLLLPDRWDPAAPPQEVLAVKGSGTDLRTIARGGFTRLSMRRLALLSGIPDMDDERMMEFMRSCMIEPHVDPVPSVETPLHSILPARFIAHTHDIVTMSLTNVPESTGRRVIEDLFAGSVVYVRYARPGYDLARAVAEMAGSIPPTAVGLALAHHGMVAWGDTAEECAARLLDLIARAENFLEERRRGKPAPLGRAVGDPPGREERLAAAAEVMPVIRGFLSREERVVLHWEDDERILRAMASEGFRAVAARGMATPEHILRSGRLPIVAERSTLASDLERARQDYAAYHARHDAGGTPIADWAKVVLVPGVGMVTAFKDKGSAQVAAVCYCATLDAMENAETIDRFEFLPEDEVFHFEHWPLERRKVEETIAKERASLLLPRHVILVIGGGSGIGEAAAHRFAEEGAHVAVADLDEDAARRVAASIAERRAGRAIPLRVDARDEASIAAAVRGTVLAYGGLDSLFYTAGLAPRFARIVELSMEDVRAQFEVHTVGALAAIREAARVMRAQGIGGSIVCSVSKAALAPGRDAAAYGASKAALLHALRVAAMELGRDGIRVNAVNADQVETPLFLRFVEARAQALGRTIDEQLATYRERNAMGVTLIPARAVAEIVVLLASDRFRYTTGDILTIDGGLPDALPR